MTMRRAGGAVAVAVAALLVSCNADPRQEQDVAEHNFGDRYDSGGHRARPESSAQQARPVRDTHHSISPPYVIRRYDYPNQYGRAEQWPAAAQPEYAAGYYANDYPKSNLDEIDRSDLNMFVTRRNFDEIDHTSVPFPYATKRFLHNYHYGSPFMMRDQAEKRLFKDYPMDEIDLSLFPLGSKRSGTYAHHVLG